MDTERRETVIQAQDQTGDHGVVRPVEYSPVHIILNNISHIASAIFFLLPKQKEMCTYVVKTGRHGLIHFFF